MIKHFAVLQRAPSREGSTERNRTICLDIWQEERFDQREQQVQRLSDGDHTCYVIGTLRSSVWLEKNKRHGLVRGGDVGRR